MTNTVDVIDDGLRIKSFKEAELDEHIDYLIGLGLNALTNDEREFLIVNGVDPDTGKNLD